MKFFFKFFVPSFFIALFCGIAFFTPSTFKSNDYLSFSLNLLTYFYVVFTWEMLLNLKQESYLEKKTLPNCRFRQ